MTPLGMTRKGRRRLARWECKGCGEKFASIVALCEHRSEAIWNNPACLAVLDPSFIPTYESLGWRDGRTTIDLDTPHSPKERITGVTP